MQANIYFELGQIQQKTTFISYINNSYPINIKITSKKHKIGIPAKSQQIAKALISRAFFIIDHILFGCFISYGYF